MVNEKSTESTGFCYLFTETNGDRKMVSKVVHSCENVEPDFISQWRSWRSKYMEAQLKSYKTIYIEKGWV